MAKGVLMEIRNIQFNAFGTIDCEIDHPEYGWIPFTASPDDVEEHGRLIYDAALAASPTPYVPPSPEEVLADERSRMFCTPAQMRLTLHRKGLLTQVQAIADSDPEASIVWEYATQIVRKSPLIDALGGPQGFTAEQIDDIFRAAMLVET
jgi:hypothetical protein